MGKRDILKPKDEYEKMVKAASPKSPLFKNCLRAFVSGGIICCIGQFLMNVFSTFGVVTESRNMLVSIILIGVASLLTGLGFYSKIGKFCGAGSIVPITGFSNSVTAPAVEFKKEGFVLGLGAKIFTVAGPVILYGTLSSILVGIIYYFVR
ncbi:MAG: stage V sporulation protein AC [Clostridiales bacterium]|nr:stage V sporulation protein AC [Clostridiales bacterium]